MPELLSLDSKPSSRHSVIAEQEFPAKPRNTGGFHCSKAFRTARNHHVQGLRDHPVRGWAAAMALNQGDKWRAQARVRIHPAGG